MHIVENTNPTFDLQLSSGDFEIKRSNGRLIDPWPESMLSGQFVDTTLSPGEKEAQTLVFQLPASQETLHLLYNLTISI